MMERIKVKSSIIVSVGYNEPTRLLEVEFRNHKIGRFINISPETYEAMMRARSIGKYFLLNIKDRYPDSVSGIKKKRHTFSR